ncbi:MULTISPECIES: hypothetical protein [Cysteiniphilum]|uniref:Uncharacterized protein n=1 Tax=Cysteiniphilum litorale TaxID=2056700 RepID=A0A8J2Z3M1_9GAMM|nr:MULTISPECIES: hypothetical protein [Cysteiniphilum]GGF93452.1 hypothetical protein GCM10010995_08260 [Cysteiniphilum litorale]
MKKLTRSITLGLSCLGSLGYSQELYLYCYANDGRSNYTYFKEDLPALKVDSSQGSYYLLKSDDMSDDTLKQLRQKCQKLLGIADEDLQSIEPRADRYSSFNYFGLNGKYGYPLKLALNDELYQLRYGNKADDYLMPASLTTSSSFDYKGQYLNAPIAVETVLTDKVKIAQFIKDSILGYEPIAIRANGLGGGFERGTILIKGLTQAQAKQIYAFLNNATRSESYQRISTHGDLVWGVDLPDHSYIQTPIETFRHVLFSMPKPYDDSDLDLDKYGSSLTSEIPSIDEVAQYVNDNRFVDKPFYIRLKPESYGFNDYLSQFGHALSYVKSKLDSSYKTKPGYYGEGDKSSNGSFVIDISADANRTDNTTSDFSLAPIKQNNHKTTHETPPLNQTSADIGDDWDIIDATEALEAKAYTAYEPLASIYQAQANLLSNSGYIVDYSTRYSNTLEQLQRDYERQNKYTFNGTTYSTTHFDTFIKAINQKYASLTDNLKAKNLCFIQQLHQGLSAAFYGDKMMPPSIGDDNDFYIIKEPSNQSFSHFTIEHNKDGSIRMAKSKFSFHVNQKDFGSGESKTVGELKINVDLLPIYEQDTLTGIQYNNIDSTYTEITT